MEEDHAVIASVTPCPHDVSKVEATEDSKTMSNRTIPTLISKTAVAEAIGTTAPLTAPIMQLLEELAQVIAALSDAQYVHRPMSVMPSHIGGHVRHSLDHVQALLAATATGRLNFDHRERGTAIETNRSAALEAIEKLIGELRELQPLVLEVPMTLHMMMHADARPIELSTTFAREAGFVLSHTIHHNAIISAMVKTLGGWLPPHFGYAPSTIDYQGKSSCAPSASSR